MTPRSFRQFPSVVKALNLVTRRQHACLGLTMSRAVQPPTALIKHRSSIMHPLPTRRLHSEPIRTPTTHATFHQHTAPLKKTPPQSRTQRKKNLLPKHPQTRLTNDFTPRILSRTVQIAEILQHFLPFAFLEFDRRFLPFTVGFVLEFLRELGGWEGFY